MARLVDQHMALLFAYAFRLTGSVDEAEELTQQTFLVAHEKIGQLREPSKVQAWLLKVLRNCFLKNRRKRRPLAASEAEMDVNLFVDDVSAESEWDTERLQQALDELPGEFRAVLLMFFFEQLSYRQIAEQLELPIGTVMSRLSRAKHHLRGKLLRRQPHTTGKQALTEH
jgi:RNA polymerase sigma-70 factor (ECF subfamily)